MTTPRGCPTYIGRIGDMIPTPCVEEVSAAIAPRVVHGGGAGTLSPSRVHVYGAGSRTWQMSRENWWPEDVATLVSLARTQAIRGGAYRFIPCDAVNHNLLTPQSSEELAGWGSVAWSWRVSFPEVEGAWADSIIPLTIPFIIGGTGGLMASGPRPAGLGKVLAGQIGTSPLFPVIRPDVQAFASVYLSGSGSLRVRAYNGAGGTTTYTRAFSSGAGVLQRVTLPHGIPAERVSARIEVAATTDVHVAWPSYAYEDNPYSSGRGCDEAHLAVTNRRAAQRNVESINYTVTEVGV